MLKCERLEVIVAENFDKLRFTISISQNNKTLIKEKKKRAKIAAMACVIGFLLFLTISIFSFYGNNSSIWASCIFIGFAALSLVWAICMFVTAFGKQKDKHRFFKFVFYEEHLEIFFVTKKDVEESRWLESCLYRKYAGKQYVSKAIEDVDKIKIQIYTGTYNFVPTFRKYILPQSSLKNEVGQNLVAFLKEKVQDGYMIKEHK